MEIAQNERITLLPAMEITSSEEVHVLAIFETLNMAMKMQELVYQNLPKAINNDRLWGHQAVVNENDAILSFNRRLLIGATGLSLKAIVDEIHVIGGLAVASHIDKQNFSVISQLGFIPDDIEFDALEVTRPDIDAIGLEQYPDIPLITSSDAHHLDEIGIRTNTFYLENASFQEIATAFRKTDGRMVLQS
jgi:PHP family Zn ribbon phosphoesterase